MVVARAENHTRAADEVSKAAANPQAAAVEPRVADSQVAAKPVDRVVPASNHL